MSSPFEAFIPRLVLASLPVVVFLAAIVLIGLRRAKRDKALVAEAAAPDPSVQASAEEEAALREKLTAALAALKQATGGKGGYLYDLPWYVFIGPPGSGKTTAIAQSGLEFPLAEGRVAGVGGTRNCDWWLTDRAVLIDTAGRYTTQDSDAAADKAGWDRFLAMLRRKPPAPAAERRAGLLRRRHAEQAGCARAPGPRPRRPQAHQGAGGEARPAPPRLPARQQGRPALRFHRIFRRPRQGDARPGLGPDLPA
jgi:hypothetical protein